MEINKKNSERLTIELLSWFENHRRDLPWRREPRNPYHVWISEIMLQQTQVQTVIGYYNRWIDRFPDIFSLSRAPLDAVLKAWEGLGYYQRARNLHKTARYVVSEYDAKLPSSSKELQKLPGIGPYTAAAIASLAFGENVIAVDGNIRRVVSRLHAVKDQMTLKMAERLLAPLFTSGKAGRVNEALMELGALCCTPVSPECETCPLMPECTAVRKGNPENFPGTKKRKRPPHIRRKGLLLFQEGRLYLTRRPHEGMLGGLWGIPLIEDPHGLTVPSIEATLKDVSHTYTHFRITVTPLVVRGGKPPPWGTEKGCFVPLMEIPRLALSTLDHKILKQWDIYRKQRSQTVQREIA